VKFAVKTNMKTLAQNIIKWVLFFLLVLVIFFAVSANAQIINDDGEEDKLYAESKQVNQFFRRFNGEEDEKGNRYYPIDKEYRNVKLRKKYMGILFDESNPGITRALKKEFTEDVLSKPEQSILDFHGSDWFAEVNAIFQMSGADKTITLYMQLEKNHLGYKWVIHKAHADALDPYFVRDTTKIGRFLHPMSHELDFMNLRKAFANSDSVYQFAVRDFNPDHLSILLYEAKKGNLKFKSVESVRFQFFQIKGWYFELSNFNRAGYNTGWLISNLVKLKADTEKEIMKRYSYHATN
jgi:hypothetical protein